MKVNEVRQWFREELSSLYEADELDEILFLVMEEVMPATIRTKTDLIIKKNEIISDSEQKRLEKIISELKLNKPVQYILGYAWFDGMKLFVNESVLIPRPETEELVASIISQISNLKHPISILDIGTGSGCIAIALKKNIPQANVFALDISEKAIEVASKNAKANHAEINFILDDVFKLQTLNNELPTLDIIVSNPPYVLHSDKSTLQARVMEHEPHLALFAGEEDALIYYRAIADMTVRFLKPGGMLFFEIHETKGNEIKEFLTAKGFKDVETRKDMSGKDRMVKAVWHS
jgi:release factor glutamine methyltransferase